MGESVRLNLGCGNKLLPPPFINVDFESNYAGVRPDVVADLSKRLPFEDGYADEVHAYHVAEHFWRWEIQDVLTEWARVLKPGGKMVLELPCLDKIIGLFVHFIQKQEPIPQWLMWGLYGDPRYKDPHMCHRWGYSAGELSELMESVGLKVSLHQPKTHVPSRDMRLEGVKCSESSIPSPTDAETP